MTTVYNLFHIVRKEEIDEIRNSIDKKLEEFMNQSEAKIKQAVADIQFVQGKERVACFKKYQRSQNQNKTNRARKPLKQYQIRNMPNKNFLHS